jgi:hypothetical protein
LPVFDAAVSRGKAKHPSDRAIRQGSEYLAIKLFSFAIGDK